MCNNFKKKSSYVGKEVNFNIGFLTYFVTRVNQNHERKKMAIKL